MNITDNKEKYKSQECTSKHAKSEKKRRDEMKNRLEGLHELLSSTSYASVNVSKLELLQNATSYIKNLHDENESLTCEVNRLNNEVNQLDNE
ncbi:1231_t:CDS:2, partial [Scutellospora calospora]